MGFTYEDEPCELELCEDDRLYCKFCEGGWNKDGF